MTGVVGAGVETAWVDETPLVGDVVGNVDGMLTMVVGEVGTMVVVDEEGIWIT